MSSSSTNVVISFHVIVEQGQGQLSIRKSGQPYDFHFIKGNVYIYTHTYTYIGTLIYSRQRGWGRDQSLGEKNQMTSLSIKKELGISFITRT